ncbi:MAG: XdhC family protein, partial [Pyrinomonadaceae bacterium]|nr:XdhC family protein [Pyrinomonadaceae bacterium]
MPAEQSPARQLIAAITRILQQSTIATIATLVSAGRDTGAKLLVEESGALTGSLHDAALETAVAQYSNIFLNSRAEARTLRVEEFAPALEAWRGAQVLFERIEPEPRLVVCGAGHVGASLTRLACLLGYRTTLIDDRADFVTRERFPDERVELVAAESWTAS